MGYIRLDGLGAGSPTTHVKGSGLPVARDPMVVSSTSGGARPTSITRTTTPAPVTRGPGLTTGTTIRYTDGSAPGTSSITNTIKDIFGSVFGAATAVAPTVAEVLALQRQRREEERLREEEAMRQANMPQSSGMGWVVPVGIAGAALLVVGVMMSRKKDTALEPKTNPRRRRRR